MENVYDRSWQFFKVFSVLDERWLTINLDFIVDSFNSVINDAFADKPLTHSRKIYLVPFDMYSQRLITSGLDDSGGLLK